MKKLPSKVAHNQPHFFSIANQPKTSPILNFCSIKIAHRVTYFPENGHLELKSAFSGLIFTNSQLYSSKELEWKSRNLLLGIKIKKQASLQRPLWTRTKIIICVLIAFMGYFLIFHPSIET